MIIIRYINIVYDIFLFYFIILNISRIVFVFKLFYVILNILCLLNYVYFFI